MSILKAIIKKATPLPKIEKFERFLFVGPHPDDIEIGAGSTAAKLVAKGKSVCFLICLDGRYGNANVDSKTTWQELAKMRQEESILSAKTLGVNDVRFLGLSDGGFYERAELTKGIASVIGDFSPQVIFAPDPCVTSECHTDHLNVGEATRRLAYFSPYDDIMKNYGAKASGVAAIAYYMTAKPNQYVKTKGFFDLQQKSIFDCHLSQFPAGSSDGKAIKMYLKLRSVIFGLRNFCACAEGFRVLGVTQMHCLPEAGN